jgi:DNA polymerase I-like protein with 3'-5' exonuclease and polymerase domains
VVEFDFKGVEVGIACCYNFDPTLMAYVKDKTKDMHRDTAMELFFLKKEEVDGKTTRHIAKNKFVFPQFYGDYYVSCAQNIWEELNKTRASVVNGPHIFDHLAYNGINRLGDCDPDKPPKKGTFEHHVKKIEDLFWNTRFPVYTAWKRSWWEQYQRRGYIEFYTGFRIGGHFDRKQVVNFPIQGSAFHCLLWCLIRLQRWLVKHGMKSRIIGQIHDSIIMDIYESELERIYNKTRQLMTETLPREWTWINVPLEVEVEASPPGQSWYHKEHLAL